MSTSTVTVPLHDRLASISRQARMSSLYSTCAALACFE